MKTDNTLRTRVVLFAIIIGFFLIRCLYIVLLDKTDRTYSASDVDIETSSNGTIPCEGISLFFDNYEERLNSIELAFTNIRNDKNGNVIIRILDNDQLIWAGVWSLENIEDSEWKKIYINIPPKKDGQYELQLTSEGCSETPELFLIEKESATNDNSQLYVGGTEDTDHIIGIKFGVLIRPTVVEKALKILSSGGIALIAILFILFWDRLTCFVWKSASRWIAWKYLNLFMLVLEMSFGYILVKESGIEFQLPTILIIFLVSVWGGYNFKNKLERMYTILNSKGKKLSFLLILLLSSFMLLGNRTLLWPINSSVTIPKMLLFYVGVIWFGPIIMTCLVLLLNNYGKLISSGKRIRNSLFFSLFILLLMLPTVISLFAFNPAISSPDSEFGIKQAHQLMHCSDWFPPFYYLFLRVAFSVWNHVTAAVIEQWILWMLVWIEAVAFLRKWLKDGALLLLATILGFNTANFLYLNTIWKDIPYCCCLIWLTLNLSKLILDEKTTKWHVYVELTLSMIGTYFFRKNGIVPYLMAFLCVLILFWKNKRAVLSVLISIPIILLIQYPLYNYLEVEKASADSMYLGFGQDIIGVYYSGGDLNSEALNMVTQLTNKDNIEYVYDPTYYNFSSKEIDITTQQFVKDVFTTAVNNPVSFIRATLVREDLVLSMFQGQVAKVSNVNYRGTLDGSAEWAKLAPERVDNVLTEWIPYITWNSVSIQAINILTWRCGIYSWLLIFEWFIMTLIWKEKRKGILMVVPIGQLLGLWLCCGWSGEFRYFWPINLMAILLFFELPVILHLSSVDKQLKKHSE